MRQLLVALRPVASLLLLTAVTLLATAPSALGAGPKGSYNADRFTGAIDIATTYWNATPCRADIKAKWTPMAPHLNAVSSWSSYGARGNPWRFKFCEIEFNSVAAWDWPKLCTVMVHEVGHLVGRDHVDDSADLMSPVYTVPLPACLHVSEAQAVAVGRAINAKVHAKAAKDKRAKRSRAQARARSRRTR